MNIYIGNLADDVSQEELEKSFEAFGKTNSVSIVKDKVSGESRGFGFVEMSSKNEGEAAIDGLNGKNLKGQSLKVNEAKPKSDNRRGGGGNGGRRPY
jgi:RNA recognition motif-containing protein